MTIQQRSPQNNIRGGSEEGLLGEQEASQGASEQTESDSRSSQHDSADLDEAAIEGGVANVDQGEEDDEEEEKEALDFEDRAGVEGGLGRQADGDMQSDRGGGIASEEEE